MRAGAFLVLLPGLVLLLSACSDHPCSPCPPIVPNPYPVAYDAPESVLVGLELAYDRREIDRYADLLARDFVFRYRPDPGFPPDSELVFAEDSLSTRNLFASNEVRTVSLDLAWGAVRDTVWEGEPVKRLDLTALRLDVEQTNNVTLRVQDQVHHFHFRPGKEALGEDPERYYLRAWEDLGPTPLGAAEGIVTWARVKLLYGN